MVTIEHIQEVLSGLSEFFTPNQRSVRLVVGGVLLLIAIVYFPWSRQIIGQYFSVPELRHEMFIDSSNNLHIKFVNLGLGRAKDVYIHIRTMERPLGEYLIDSQEPYRVVKVDPKGGELDISLDRLSSDASIAIVLFGFGEAGATTISATSLQGSSRIIDTPVMRGEIDQKKISFSRLFQSAKETIRENKHIADVRNWLLERSVPAKLYSIFASKEFRNVSGAILVVAALLYLFTPTLFKVFFPPMMGFIVWLFFDFFVPVWFFIVVFTLLLVRTVVVERYYLFNKEILPVLISLIVGGIGLFGVWWFWYDRIDINWLLGLLTTLFLYIVCA